MRNGFRLAFPLFFPAILAWGELGRAHADLTTDSFGLLWWSTSAPKGIRRDTVLEKHGEKRIDPYFWYKDKENPEIKKHLQAENAYTAKTLSPKTQKKLFTEMKGRTTANETSLPHRIGRYEYFHRYIKGKEHPIYYRRKVGSKRSPQLLIDVNEVAKRTGFADCPSPAVSPNGNYLAYACDLSGQLTYTIRFKNLLTNTELPTVIDDADATVVWASDNQTIFATAQDETTLRSSKVLRLNVIDGGKPTEVYSERDASFTLSLYQSVNRGYIFVECASTTTKSVLYIPSHQPQASFAEFQPRVSGLEYTVQDGRNEFFILTNWNAENFKIMRTPIAQTGMSNWKSFGAYNPRVYTTEITVLRDSVIADVYQEGWNYFEVIDRKNPDHRFAIRPTDPISHLSLRQSQDYNARTLHFLQESLTEPRKLVNYSLAHKKVKSSQQTRIPNYEPADYESLRDWATVRDGTRVPLTILKSKKQKFDGKNPTLIMGYGAYGTIDEMRFAPEIFSLIDRGFVVVYAHVRGGGLLGRTWFNQGRKHLKMNTFYDFIDSTEHLIKSQVADPHRIFAHGMSAGGLLMGAINNMRPDLYRGIIAEVPFVDVLTTMLDESIPLTTSEYEEWGNPNIKSDYEDMRAYSPYDNISAQAYPNILAIAGWNDGQVSYWEPAKWVSKLRDYNTSSSTIMLKTNMNSGHEGPSGRYGAMKDLAVLYTFLLQNL